MERFGLPLFLLLFPPSFSLSFNAIASLNTLVTTTVHRVTQSFLDQLRSLR